jgi:cytochrome c-type biogenesis protein CcmH/NrfF
MRTPRFIPLLFLALAPCLVVAETAEQQEVRIGRLEHAVLAPCCYTESVAVHQSEIAVKMRLEIAKWVEAGKSDREILDTYVGLYGSKVLVDPRTIPAWWTPWVPWIALVLGVVLLILLLKRWRPNPRARYSPSDFEGRPLPDIEDEDSAL